MRKPPTARHPNRAKKPTSPAPTSKKPELPLTPSTVVTPKSEVNPTLNMLLPPATTAQRTVSPNNFADMARFLSQIYPNGSASNTTPPASMPNWIYPQTLGSSNTELVNASNEALRMFCNPAAWQSMLMANANQQTKMPFAFPNGDSASDNLRRLNQLLSFNNALQLSNATNGVARSATDTTSASESEDAKIQLDVSNPTPADNTTTKANASKRKNTVSPANRKPRKRTKKTR